MMNHVSTRNYLLAAAVCAAVGTPAGAQDLVLEEVIVTAQKRVESLAETPMTVNVLSGEQIAETATFTFNDLGNLTAGLTIFGSAFDTDIGTRGLGTDLNGPVTPRVTVYLDGAYISQQRALFSAIYDMSQVELLRGPQGTLYGQASPAGAVILQSQNPNLEQWDGRIQQSFTDRKGANTQIGVSIPLIKNQLGIRVAGLYDTNEATDVTNITQGKDLERETTAYRIVALWEPTDNFNLRFAYHDIDEEGDIDTVVKGSGLKFDDRISVGDFDSTMEGDTDYAILEMNYSFGDTMTATFVGSYQDNILQRDWDGDSSEVQGQEQFVLSDVTSMKNYEIRLASQGNDFWDWTIGGYYQDAPSQTPVVVQTFTAVGGGFVTQTETTGPAILDSQYYGLFSHNTLYLSENGTLTVGLRYIEEDRDNSQTFVSITDLIEPFFLPEVDVRSQDGVAPEDQQTTDDAVTGTLKYQYQFTDDFMAYASYDRGWRGGTSNIAGAPQPPVFGLFDAEESDNIEFGFKWGVMEGRGLWNFALYYQTYTDFQYLAEVAFRTPEAGIDIETPVVNVDEAEVYGFDSDFTILVSEQWTLSAAVSYNSTELSDASDVPCINDEPIGDEVWSFNTCDLTGDRAGNLPEWSANLFTEYFIPTGSGNSEWYARALLNWESEYYSNTEEGDLDSYTTLDLFLGWRTASRSWDAQIWARNVFDETAELDNEAVQPVPDYDNPAGGQLVTGYTWVRNQLNPRTIGLTVSYNF